jgi:hypothetical protein
MRKWRKERMGKGLFIKITNTKTKRTLHLVPLPNHGPLILIVEPDAIYGKIVSDTDYSVEKGWRIPAWY